MNFKEVVLDSIKEDVDVLIFGDIMLDKYNYGTIDRVSPEAPVLVFNVGEDEYRLGGAANVANNIRKLGSIPHMTSIVGECGSDWGQCYKLFTREQVNMTNVLHTDDRKFTIKTRLMAQNQQVLRVDIEDTKPVSTEDVNKLIYRIVYYNKINYKSIIIQDYAKGVVTQESVDQLCWYAKDNNIPVLVDPNPRNKIDYKGRITLFKPNLKEALEYVDMKEKLNDINKELEEENIDILEEVGSKLYEQTEARYIYITLSEHGMICFDQGKFMALIPAYTENEIIDVTGAGDTAIASLAISLSGETDMPMGAGFFSSIACSIAIKKLGTSPVTLEEVKNEIEEKSSDIFG